MDSKIHENCCKQKCKLLFLLIQVLGNISFTAVFDAPLFTCFLLHVLCNLKTSVVGQSFETNMIVSFKR